LGMLIRFDLPFHGTTYLQVVTNEPAASGPGDYVKLFESLELHRLLLYHTAVLARGGVASLSCYRYKSLSGCLFPSWEVIN